MCYLLLLVFIICYKIAHKVQGSWEN